MKNLLILFNPYYKADVIEQHLNLLVDNEKVAFGKIRSTLKNVEHSFQDELAAIYEKVSEENYLQLFLTDYSNIYVAKVTLVTDDDLSDIAPSYYKDLEVEKWFMITDMREILRNDFENVRENIFSNFRTPNFNDRSYAIYGNNYVYPLIIDMKTEIDYFESSDEEFRHYPDMFKSSEYLEMKKNFIEYSFGDKWINRMHPNSLDNIISAEMEYIQNRLNPRYDFSTVIIKYAKTMEQELYVYIKALFSHLLAHDSSVGDVTYSVQSREYKIKGIFTHKPNIGTYKFLLKEYKVKKTIESSIENYHTKKFISSTIPYYINMIQKIRNESVHGEAAKLSDVVDLRKSILGISKLSILVDVIKGRSKIK